MAFYEDNEEEDKNGQGSAEAQTSAQSGTIDGQGATPGGSSAAPAQAAAGSAPASTEAKSAPASKPDNPGNFVGIHQYLDANKNQAAKLGDQTAGVINNSANTARQNISGLNQAATTAIQPTQSLGADILGQISSAPESLSDQQKNAIKSTETATYTGPKSATDLGDAYTNAASATQAATNNISNSGTEQGRMGLISQVNSAPRTQGENVFDNALLQVGNGRDKLAQASSANQDIPGALTNATNQIQTQIGQATDQTTKAQQDASTAVQNALSQWKAGFAPKVTDAQNQLVAQQNALTKDIANPNSLTDQDLQTLGLQSGQRLFNTNLNDYLTPASATDINAGNVASAQDYARYGALADLAGDTSNYLNPANIGNAGKMPSLVNQAGLQSALSQAQQNFDALSKSTNFSNNAEYAPDAGYSANANVADYLKDSSAINHGQYGDGRVFAGAPGGNAMYLDPNGAGTAAGAALQAKANSGLIDKINAFLSAQGYGNTVGSTSDLRGTNGPIKQPGLAQRG